MELQLYMLHEFDDKTIADMTGIKEITIRHWRKFMDSKIQDKSDHQKKIVYRYDTLPGRESEKRFKVKSERTLQNLFVNTLNEKYQEYVRIPFGIIDILTDTTIYELKIKLNNSSLQKAVGQIMLYSTEVKNRRKVLVANEIRLSDGIMEQAERLGIEILIFDTKDS